MNEEDEESNGLLTHQVSDQIENTSKQKPNTAYNLS